MCLRHFLAILVSITIAARVLAALVIVDGGRPRASVVAAPADTAAAQELVTYIERSTGAKLVLAPIPPKEGAVIYVGFASAPNSIQRELAKHEGDTYVIRTLDDTALVLAGNGRNGTKYAVDAFLQQQVGVRWLWPGELGEVVPQGAALTVPETSILREPAYVWRDLGPGGALWGPRDKLTAERELLGVSSAHQQLEQEWEQRSGFGGELIYGGHAMGEILPPAKYGPQHPEYYALLNGRREWERFDGKHGTQPCTTNADVIRIVTDYAGKFFDRHPDYDAFAVSLNDGGGFCECDRCRALDSGHVVVAGDDPEGGKAGRKAVITDRIVTFANIVAENLARTHPGKKVILFAYGQYKQPPSRVKMHPNVIIQYTFHVSNNWNPESESQQLRETGAWSSAASRLGIYEYFIQGNFPDLPRPMAEPIQRSVQKLRAQGYRYYQTQSGDGYAINGLNYYLLGRLLWDPQADIAALQADYFARGFGLAAPAVARYFGRLDQAWRALAGKSVAMDAATRAQYARVAEAYPKELRAACARDLAEAATVATGRERDRVEFLRRGLHYVDLTVTAIDRTLPLFDAGWKLDKAITPPANADLSPFVRARNSWEERDRYIETLKDQFVIAYFWVRYNEQNRTFVPLERMRAFKAE
jgi:hypothetical protein